MRTQTVIAATLVFLTIAFLAVPAKALPIVLYSRGDNDPSYWDGDNWPFDVFLYDDSCLLYMRVLGYEVRTRVVNPPGTHGTVQHQNPHLYPCPGEEISINRSWTGQYEESYQHSVSATINSEIGAEFDGVGAKVGTSVTEGHTYGETISKGYTLSVTETTHVPAGAYWDWSYTDYYIRIWGDGLYFLDEAVNSKPTFTWSIEATYDMASNGFTVTGGTPCPEPLTVLGVLFGVGGVAGYIRRRRMAA